MQLYALDHHGNPIFASNALKGVDYICCECRSHVRVREGPHRRAHFYHHQPSSACRQNGKSIEHLQVQYHFQDLLPPGEGAMEVSFPSIGRIADFVWEREKIIFEIQCSPISAAEVIQRNRDYASQGYQVVWIFHDQRFNKRRATASELWLQQHPHYFTNIDQEGRGDVYDQWSRIENGCRQDRSEASILDIRRVLRLLPEGLTLRKTWPLFFLGDLIDRGKIQKFTDTQENKNSFFLKPVIEFLKKAYRIIFRHLLEKSCH